MRIQHNIAALNSYRNLTSNNNSVSKNLEKLSSGYKINRAGDDAAGLAISEKMRAQITGLETAQKNANDGISLVQTAEGALTEVHSMLNRMVELSDQSANGTYADATDRENLQKEVTSLKDEINRISEGTNFNGINLLDGSLATKGGATSVSTIKANQAPVDSTATGGAKFSQTLTVAAGTDTTQQTLSFKYLDKEGNIQNAEVKFTAGADVDTTSSRAATELAKVFGDSYDVTAATDGSGKITIQAKEIGADQTQIISAKQLDGATDVTPASAVSAVVAGKDDAFTIDADTVYDDVTKNNFLNIDGTKYQILTRGKTVETGAKALYIDQTSNALSADSVAQVVSQLKDYGVNASVDPTDTQNIVIGKASDSSKAKGGLTLQIGDTSADFNQMRVNVSSMDTRSLGIDGIDISTQQGAKDAVDLVKSAINSVSSTRGDLGAIQNRLEHTINNLSVTTENMTAAESRIRDVDMADEMMAYTKNNILVQASQAMLAQANQVPQGVLQLLQ